MAIRSFAGDQARRRLPRVAAADRDRRAVVRAPRRGGRRDRRVVRRRAPGLGHGRQGHGHPQLGAAGRDRPRVRARTTGRVEQDLDDSLTLLYSGTLGLKHNPALLVELAGAVRDAGHPVRLVVVNEGPASRGAARRGRAARRTADPAAVPALRAAVRGARQRRHPGRAARAGRRRVLGAVQDAVLPVRRPAGARPDAGRRTSPRQLVAEAAAACAARRGLAAGAAARWAREVLADDSADGPSSGSRRARWPSASSRWTGCADRFEQILARRGPATPDASRHSRRVSIGVRHCRSGAPSPRTAAPMKFTTMLTKRRAVDHCRVRSSLCRRS